MAEGTEYRVRWRREGRGQATRIYQSKEGALRKVEAILALERVKEDTSRWADMPDLAERPVIETRSVGQWTGDVEYPDPSARALERVADWAGARDDGYGPFS